MKELDKKKSYDLSELTSKELEVVYKSTFRPGKMYKCLYYSYYTDNWVYSTALDKSISVNAKELFYTLENVQVDCSELTEEQTKKMCDIYENKGYYLAIHAKENDEEARVLSYNNITQDGEFGFYKYDEQENNEYTITYEKFMELFSYKEKSKEFNNLVEVLNEELTEEACKETEYEVKYIAEKPKQYQAHYNNENGSLYKIATDLGLNHWEFDIFKRLVRCRKKNQFKEDLQKIKDTIDIYLNEYSE